MSDQVDAHPFKHWYESHYGVPIGLKKGKKAAPKDEAEVRMSNDPEKGTVAFLAILFLPSPR